MKRFGPSLLLAATLLALSHSAMAAQTDLDLATSKNCMGCHAIDRKVLGPAYKDVAAKYRNDPAAPARLTQKVLTGGGGVWGTAKMPSNPQVTEAEAKRLVAWLLRQ